MFCPFKSKGRFYILNTFKYKMISLEQMYSTYLLATFFLTCRWQCLHSLDGKQTT